MTKKIYILCDYQNRFNNKRYSKPYRGGMDKQLLLKYFNENMFDVEFMQYSNINLRNINFKDKFVLYTSSEDRDYYYKSFVEDICLAIELQGGILIPDYKYLYAHSNKVFMEMLRDISDLSVIKNIKTRSFGCLEELYNSNINLPDKNVVKLSGGAKSNYVYLARNKKQLSSIVKKISKTKKMFYDMWDIGRSLKYKNYQRESVNRRKFLVQSFVSGLANDWKILCFDKKYYIISRSIKEGDFRASGSGMFDFCDELPNGILDFAEKIYTHLNVPNVSIDVGYDGKEFYLFEFQCLYFGTTVIEKSPFYFTREQSDWVIHREKSILEKEYVVSIVEHIKKLSCV